MARNWKHIEEYLDRLARDVYRWPRGIVMDDYYYAYWLKKKELIRSPSSSSPNEESF